MRKPARLDPDRRSRWSRTVLLLIAVTLFVGGRQGRAQDAPRQIPRPVWSKDRALRPAAFPTAGEATKPESPQVEVSTSLVRTDLPAVPGAKLALEAGRGAPEGTRFRWVQIEGPPVEIVDPSRPTIQITIPAGAERLGFVLIAARPEL